MAQNKRGKNNSWEAKQMEVANRVYTQAFSGPNSSVFQGYQYVPFILPIEGNPFYPSNKWHTGSVCFKNVVYHHVRLLYDIMKDELVLQNANKRYRILMKKKYVRWFTLDSLHFIRINSPSKGRHSPSLSGYYEELVADGPALLLVKRKKNVVIPTSAGQSRTFLSHETYYIKKDNRYYKVKSRHSVLKVLEKHKKAIRKYLRKNKLYFSKNRENTIKQAVIFYNKMEKGAP